MAINARLIPNRSDMFPTFINFGGCEKYATYDSHKGGESAEHEKFVAVMFGGGAAMLIL